MIHVLLIFVAFSGFLGAQGRCKLYDYCGRDGFCTNFTSLTFISASASDCLRTDNGSVFHYFDYLSRFTVGFNDEPNVLKVDPDFDIHLWKWIFYNHMMYSSTEIKYCMTITNAEFGELGKYSSSYTDLDMTGFQFNEIKLILAKNTKQLACDKSTGSWDKFLKLLTQQLYIKSGKYSSSFCLLWLRGVQLDSLTFDSKHQFQVSKIDETMRHVNFSSNITSLSFIAIKKLVLDQNLLNSKIFVNLKSLEIKGEVSLASITPTSLFQDLTKLNYLGFRVINTRGFFHSVNGTSWMTYLNYHVHLDIDQIMKTITIDETTLQYVSSHAMIIEIFASNLEDDWFPFNSYLFPDEDLCLFREFPHKQLVVPVIVKSYFNYVNCSCTLAWLLKYYFLFYQHLNLTFVERYSDSLVLCSPDDMTDLNRILDSCNMSHRLGICSIEESQGSHDAYFDLYDLKNGLQAAYTYLLNYFGPIFCFAGIATNLVIIIVFSHNKFTFNETKQVNPQDNKILLVSQRLYQLMLINAIVNLIYCLMYFLDLTINCTPTPMYHVSYNSYFSDRLTFENCLIKDMVIGFIGSSLRIISNSLLIFISLNRYILIGKDHAEFLVKLSSMSKRKLLISTGIVSCLLSVIVVFQYIAWSYPRIRMEFNLTLLYSYDYYQTYYALEFDKSPITNNAGQLDVLITFSVIHDCFSYLIFCIIILILDVATVTKLKETLAQKSAFTKTSDNQEKKEKAEVKSITMVCINSVVNFLLRLPEILSMVAFIFFDVNPYIYKILCFTFSRCLILYDLSNISYILSLSTPLFFYMGFNNLFHAAFKALLDGCSCQKRANKHS